MQQQQGHYLDKGSLLLRHEVAARLITTTLLMVLICSGSSRGIILIRALQFEHPTFDRPEDVADITFVTQAWYADGPDAYYNKSAVWLTPAYGFNASQDSTNLGRIVYKDPILLFFDNTNTFLSFNTSFTFQIITTAPDGACGSGMAFFISETEQAPNKSNYEGSFGLRNPYNPTPAEDANRFFAVEFDTRLHPINQDPSHSHIGIDINSVTSESTSTPNYSNYEGSFGLRNPYNATPAEEANRFFAVEFDTRLHPINQDPSYSHIGIDINSVTSSNTTDTTKGNPFYPDLYLYSNFTFIAWIEYNASSNLIQVWMTNVNTTSSHERPAYPCLQLHYDLSTLFLQRYVYVGFSATTAPRLRGLEGHAIYSWNFSNEDPFTSTSSSNISSNSKLGVALGAALGGGLLVSMALCAGVYIWIVIRRRRRNATYQPMNANNNIQEALRAVPRYSYKELKRATQGFGEKNKAGEGGFSSVYRGTLADGSVVVVKKLKQSVRMDAEFCAEIGIISRIRHRYLLELQGWCYENGEALLVYKFMENGSLDGFLFGKKKGALGRETRFRILEGVAAALEYLHAGLGDCVLHRDVKAANVLLTEELEPKLSGFGLARLIRHDEMVSMTAAGTPGYVAPEVVYRGRATQKADVYSFGVLALEVACGRRVSMERSMYLVEWVWLFHSNVLTDALDPSISDDVALKAADQHEQALMQWRCVLHVALQCCHPSPNSRPTMRQVTQTLHDRVLLPLPTTRPAYPYAITANTSPTTTQPPDYHHRQHQRRPSALADPLTVIAGSALPSSISSSSTMQVTTSSLSTTSTTTFTQRSMNEHSPDSEPLSPR